MIYDLGTESPCFILTNIPKFLFFSKTANIMKDFKELVEFYMQCDKKTLAELLALRDLRETEGNNINWGKTVTPMECPPYPAYQWPYDYPWNRLWETWITTPPYNIT